MENYLFVDLLSTASHRGVLPNQLIMSVGVSRSDSAPPADHSKVYCTHQWTFGKNLQHFAACIKGSELP